MVTDKNDTNKPLTELVEFIKSCRTLTNQLQIMSKIKMSKEDSKITQNAARNLSESIKSYISQAKK